MPVTTDRAVLAARLLSLSRPPAPTPSPRRWRASLLTNLGCALVDAGSPGQALAAFTEALRLRESEGDRRSTQIACWMVGWAMRLVGRPDEARTVQLALLEALHADGIGDAHVARELHLLSRPDA